MSNPVTNFIQDTRLAEARKRGAATAACAAGVPKEAAATLVKRYVEQDARRVRKAASFVRDLLEGPPAT